MTDGSPGARLRQLVDQGVTPDAYGLLPGHADLVDELVAHHGTLVLARRAMSIPVHRIARKSEEAVAAELRELAARGVRLTARRLRQLGEDRLVRDAYRQFGSLRAAIVASGAAPPARQYRRRASRTRDEVVSELRALADRDGAISTRVPNALSIDARCHFGTIADAIAAAGLVPRHPRQRWTRTAVVDALADRLAQGAPMSAATLRAAGLADLASAAQRWLGSWQAADAAAQQALLRRARSNGRSSIARSLAADLTNAVDAYRLRYLELVIEHGRRAVEHPPPVESPPPRSVERVHPELALDPARLDAVLTRVAKSRKLTPRQLHAVAALVHSVPRNRIAEVLGVGENTVKTFLQAVVRKLGVHSCDEAVWWIRNQVVRRRSARSRA